MATYETKLMQDELLTINEVAAWLKVERSTILSRIKKRVYVKGVHFYSPRGSRPRFSRLALQAWLEERDLAEVKEDIPMSQGYSQGKIRLTG